MQRKCFGTSDISKVVIGRATHGPQTPPQYDHSHQFYELLYIQSGKCRFLLKDTIYYMEKGDFVFIVPGELHHANCESEVCEISYIYFKDEYLEYSLFRKWLENVYPQVGKSFTGKIPALYQEDFLSLLGKMRAEHASIDTYSNAFLACYLQEIMLFLSRHCLKSSENPAMVNPDDADILAATKYIYSNFRSPLTLEEVASVASLSPTYFSKKFKQVTGMGFKQYLNFVRLKHAQTALLTTSNTITDIALTYGFNDSNYFKDLFKKIYGKSPREFRKNPN